VDPLIALTADWSAVTRARDGEKVSGDRFLIHEDPDGLLIAAVDGLGHGPEAAAAAESAIQVFERDPLAPLTDLLERAHRALLGTRGAAALLARTEGRSRRLDWIGVGQILGMVRRAESAPRPRHDVLLTRRGVVGKSILAASLDTTPIGAGDILVVASDGIRREFLESPPPFEGPERMARHILEVHRRPDDDALVAVVRFRSAES
jgi:phosphoserine phosphatase RsbX